MGIQDFNTLFNNLDTECRGYVTADQIFTYYNDIAYDAISYDHVCTAVQITCNHQSSERVYRDDFIEVLEELFRRQNVEDQAYWDFQALDYGASNRISLRDALLLFREFHGSGFSMATWKQFLKSREEPNASVYFDEIRLWLCSLPSGEPATEEQIQTEEDRLKHVQEKFELDEMHAMQRIMDDEENKEQYRDATSYHAQRKLNKWKKQGVEAMLNDDGLDVDDVVAEQRPKDHVTMNDLMEALDAKYDMLREKLLLEMASQSTAIEGDQPEVYQELCSQERQLRRGGTANLEEKIGKMSGSKIPLPATLTGLMGETRQEDLKRKQKVEEIRKELKSQGMADIEINNKIQQEYQLAIQGDTTCGMALVNLHQRYRAEKEDLIVWLRQSSGQATMSVAAEYNRLSRQQMLIGDEVRFVGAAVAVGLAERTQEYKTSRDTDWDRSRTERLAQIRLLDKKGRKQVRTSKEQLDLDACEAQGHTGIQRQFIAEIVKKHFYERETLIAMLQGRDSAMYKTQAKGYNREQRNKTLKTLRNKHKSWKQSKWADSEVLWKTLQEGVGLCYENTLEDLRQGAMKTTEEEVNEVILANLHQKQDVEFQEKLALLHSKGSSNIIGLLAKESKERIQEHFDNVAFVILGVVEIRDEDKEYLDALMKKYNTIREKIFLMGLRDHYGIQWKSFPEDEKKKEMLSRRREEKELRGQGLLTELEGLVGPKSKTLAPLRKLLGEDKAEFEVRFTNQKATGTVADEVPADRFIPTNHLADLVPRYDSEEEAMLSWLHSDSIKALPLKIQRLKILLLRLESFSVRLEDNFEVAALGLGLLERIEASLHGRHLADEERQIRIAQRRVQIRQQRLLQREPYVKQKQPGQTPANGDLTGWQVCYLSEVLLRQGEERELLLQYLQDEGLEDLTEAANMMSDEEKKERLAELHSKRRHLNLENSDDQEENVSILEEAVAIRSVCKRAEMEKLSGIHVNMEEVTVNLLRELQEEQDKELATLLGLIGKLGEEDIKKRQRDELKCRNLGSFGNVFVILTQSEGKAHETALLKALQAKYERLQECVLYDCLCHRTGKQNWNKLSERERQQKVLSLVQQVRQHQASGNTIGLWELVGDVSGQEPVVVLMGSYRTKFKQSLKNLGDEDEVSEEEPDKEKKSNPLIDLWQRFEEEKQDLMHALKGLEEEYMGEKEQELHLIRLEREKMLGCRHDNFPLTASSIGLAERQLEKQKPRMSGDEQRYSRLAKQYIESGMKHKDRKADVSKSKVKVAHMQSVTQMLEYRHQEELEYLSELRGVKCDPRQVEQAVAMSQQQRKDRLAQLMTTRQDMPPEQQKDHWQLLVEGIILKREICRERLGAGEDNTVVDQSLFAELLSLQNCEVECIFSEIVDTDVEDLTGMQQEIKGSRDLKVNENVAEVVFKSEAANKDTDVLEALDGKYDALRDKLLLEALMKQYGETEWNRLSDLERQKKLMELKLKERQLRRDGKFDELAKLLGDAFEDQETLKQLLGNSKEEQERKLRERLERRQKRLAQGMSEEECDKLEEKEIAAEEEEERQRRRNILHELDHEYAKEKDELMRRLAESDDQILRERLRQLELMKLRRDERRARKEEKFDSAALVIGIAEEQNKKMLEDREEEKQRQIRLAKERLEAARRRKLAGKDAVADDEPKINIDTEDKIVLREAVTVEIDRRHEMERDFMIQMLENNSDSVLRDKVRNMSQEGRKDRLAELSELRKIWRQGETKDKQQHQEILEEAACIQLESLLDKMRSEGVDVTEDQVKVHLLSELQQEQDKECHLLTSDLQNKDAKTLQQMVQVQRKLQQEGWHDNVAQVLVGKSSKKPVESHDKDDDDGQMVDALEQKYETLREKLMEAALIKEMGEDEWNNLSDEEKQKKLVEVKLREKKLREQGKTEEASQLYGDLSEENEVLDSLLDGRDEDQKLQDKMDRKEELRKERAAEGLDVDDATLEQIVEEEEKEKMKEKRKNVLENLQNMFDDEKAALLAGLESQKDRIAKERERQLAIAKLRRDQNRMKREEKLDSVALIFSMAHEADEKHRQSIEADRERQRALAKERLEARKKRKQKPVDENLEEKLQADDDAANVEEMTSQQQHYGSAVHQAILETMEKRQKDERDLLMELMSTAQKDTKACQRARQMSPEDIKLELSKLESEQKEWRKKSQQMALNMDETVVNKKLWENYYKRAAESRKQQTKLLNQAIVLRLQLEENNLHEQKPDMSEDSLKEETSLSLLTDLQQKQDMENKAVQELMQSQDDYGLQRMKKLQRTARREGWYDSLTGTMFQLSGAEGDEAGLEMMNKMKAEMEEELEKEKQAFIENAKRKGADIDVEAALRELEAQQEAKRRAMTDSLYKQQKSLKERIAARKMNTLEKESQEIAAVQLIMMAESKHKETQEKILSDKGKQKSLLQERLEARRLERKRNAEAAKLDEDETPTPSRNTSSQSSRMDVTPPPFGLTREKTVVDVNVSDAEKQATLVKLVREQTIHRQKISDQQKQQEEMLKRKLEMRNRKRQDELLQLFDQGERNKTTYQKSKEDEKSRQSQAFRERMLARQSRERSKSPKQMTIQESPKTPDKKGK